MKLQQGSYSIFSNGQKNPEKNSAFKRQQKGIVFDEHFPSSVFVQSCQFDIRLRLPQTPCSVHNHSFEPLLTSRLLMAAAVHSAAQGSLVFPIQWQGPTMVLHRNLDPEPVRPGSWGDNLQWPGDKNAQHQQPDGIKEQVLIPSIMESYDCTYCRLTGYLTWF